MSFDRAELDRRFDHQPPDQRRALMHENVRHATKEYVTEVLVLVGADEQFTREQHIFITKMEEALMWANADIARNVPDEEETQPTGTSDSSS